MSYTLRSTTALPDYNGEGRLYEHDRSGAQVFHVHNDDSENMFSFAFSTLPENSTGVAHILEHTVLSGSEAFPLKDPFLHLMKGSVHTFLNAMTYPDRTVYPAASPVEQDLFNLMKVYGDAVFFPLLKPELFRQEGHRLQFRADGTLEHSGVVFNEMKGSYASHDSIAAERCYQSLFPDTVYRHDSGGDPLFIPDLTYEDFVAFHRRYYHPANARIVLYGNIPTDRYLEFLDREFLSRFSRQDAPKGIERQKRWTEPRSMQALYPVPADSETNRLASVTVNWLLFPVTESDRLLEVSALAEMLLGHSGAPLQKALIDSGLGQDLSPVFGLETDLYEAILSAGLRGTDADQSEEIERLITTTLSGLVDAGLDDDLREGALRRIEFRNRELKSGPNGMRVMGRALRCWAYGGHPADGLHFTASMQRLRGRLAEDPRLFERMITGLLLENPHRTTVIVEPAPGLATDQEDEERAELQALLSAMEETDRNRILREQAELDALQDADDDPVVVASIPRLSLDDVPRAVNSIACTRGEFPDGIPVFRHERFTNGILYVDLSFDLQGIPPEWIDDLNLFASAFTEVGVPGMPFEEFQRQANLNTGGISTMLSNQYRSDDPSRLLRFFTVRVRLLEQQLESGIALFERLLETIDYADTVRLKQVFDEVFTELQSALIPSGHYFAGVRAAARLSSLALIEDRIGGISQYRFLERTGESDPAELSGRLRKMAQTILNPKRMTVNLTADDTAMDSLERRVRDVVDALGRVRTGGAGVDLFAGETVSERLDLAGPEFLVTSSGVSYVAQAVPGKKFLEPGYAAQEVLAHLLRTGSLWEQIRMAGGAYGAFASSKSLEGLFSFGSYRDPHSTRTLGAFRSALENAARTPPDEREVELALISLLGKELRPMVPREEGFVDYKRRLYGISDEMRQRVRDDMRSVTGRAVQEAAAFLLEQIGGATFSILGGETAKTEVQASHQNLVCTELGI